jgi:hypothetical protein
MATRGSIPKIMEMAGVQMLPPEAGIAWIRRELTSGSALGEVVVAGELGLMAAEWHPSGGLAQTQLEAPGPMAQRVRLSSNDGLLVETDLNPAVQPFLDDHRIDGTPVLPGVMGMEAFAEAAALLTPPGYRVACVEDVAFVAPVKFYRDEPRTLRVRAITVPEPSGDLLVRCELSAERTLAGQEAPVRQVHFTGTVRLSQAESELCRVELDLEPHEPVLSADQVYSFYFHGPAYQVVNAAWAAGEGSMAEMADLPTDRVPADAPLRIEPRLVELCFQAAGLWEAGREGQLALPTAVARLSVDAAVEPGSRLVATAHQTAPGTFDCRVVDADGVVLVRLDGYRSIPVPMPIPDEVSEALRDAFAD